MVVIEKARAFDAKHTTQITITTIIAIGRRITITTMIMIMATAAPTEK